MFYHPFNPKTFKVYDLTRSTLKVPYELDYGYAKVVCDRSYYDSFNKTEAISCMLSPSERELKTPFIAFTKNDLIEMRDYSLKELFDPIEYKLGYQIGYNDVVTSYCRKTFEIESCRELSFLVGYELGIYVATMYRTMFDNFV